MRKAFLAAKTRVFRSLVVPLTSLEVLCNDSKMLIQLDPKELFHGLASLLVQLSAPFDKQTSRGPPHVSERA